MALSIEKLLSRDTSLTTGSKYKNLTWKLLVFWRTDCLGGVVACGIWVQVDVQLYSIACQLSDTNTIFNFSVG